MEDRVRFSARIDRELWDKLKELADKNRRSINAELMVMLEKHIRQESK